MGLGIYGVESLDEGIVISLVLRFWSGAQQCGDRMDACDVMGVVAIVDSVEKLCVFGFGGHDSSEVMDGDSV